MEETNYKGSRKGIELRIGRKWRTWSRRVVHQDNCVVRVDGMEQSCLGKLPPEILREILMKLEKSESQWPMRSNVITCAGVCKSWREIIKEIVKTPELCGNITFPISVKQPGPRENNIKCFIKRNRAMQTYHLYLSLTDALAENGKLLLAARKCRRTTCNAYIISLQADEMSNGGSAYVGKLRSNFLGTKFTVFDPQLPHNGAKMMKSCSVKISGQNQVSPRVTVGNYAVAHISYELNVLGSRGPRKMICAMNTIPTSAIRQEGVAPTLTELAVSNSEPFPSLPFFRSKSNRMEDNLFTPVAGPNGGALILRNKFPRWHEQLQCWCLNFHGRVTVASVKNFQLVASPEGGPSGPEHEKVVLQFGKVGKDVFTMDYCYPISAFQAFVICLSSFDTKIACE